MKGIEHRPSQNQRILEYMAKYGSITSLEALEHLGVARLASRICDLKMRGYPIYSKMEKVTNRHGEICRIKRYRLLSDKTLAEQQKTDSDGK